MAGSTCAPASCLPRSRPRTSWSRLARDGTTLLGPPTDAHFRRRYRLPRFAATERGFFCAIDLAEGEPVYGHGEKWSRLDHRGQLLTSWNEDALGVNAEASYKNCPFAWSPRGWGLFVHTPGRVTHGVGFAPFSHRSYTLEVEDERLDLFLIAAADPAGVIERFTWLTGRPAPVPRWSLGRLAVQGLLPRSGRVRRGRAAGRGPWPCPWTRSRSTGAPGRTRPPASPSSGTPARYPDPRPRARPGAGPGLSGLLLGVSAGLGPQPAVRRAGAAGFSAHGRPHRRALAAPLGQAPFGERADALADLGHRRLHQPRRLRLVVRPACAACSPWAST